jgi:hypothetical protein
MSNFHSNCHIFTHWEYFTQSFCYFVGRSWFFEILDFLCWSLHMYGALLADDNLGLIIKVAKGGISSN